MEHGSRFGCYGKNFLRLGLPCFLVLLASDPALGDDGTAPTFDTGDTAWVLTSIALVIMMTAPGLALLLRWTRSVEKRPIHDNAQFLLCGTDQRRLGAGGILIRIRAW